MASCGALKSIFLFSPLAQVGHNSSTLLYPSTNATRQYSSKRKIGFGMVAVAKDNAANETQQLKVANRSLRTSLKYSGEKPATPILDTITYPVNMNNLCVEDLEKLANELREEIVYTLSKTGGHLSSNLGVAELTVSLHHVFDTPDDKIIWDVGHQSYPHKILTGRRSRMGTIRQTNGLAGFPKREESQHDAFGAGHSSTSISAGLGTFLNLFL